MYADIIDNFSAPLVTGISGSDYQLDVGPAAYDDMRTKMTNVYEGDEPGFFVPYSGSLAQYFTIDDGTQLETVEVQQFDDNAKIIHVYRSSGLTYAPGALVAARPNAKTLEALHESAVIAAANDRLAINYETDVSFSAADYAGLGTAAITVVGAGDIDCTLPDFEGQMIRSRVSHADVRFELTVFLLGTGSVTFITSDSTIDSPNGEAKLNTQFGRVVATWLPPAQLSSGVGRWVLDSNSTLVAP